MPEPASARQVPTLDKAGSGRFREAFPASGIEAMNRRFADRIRVLGCAL